MRAALWLLVLFGVAVASALFAGNNQGTVTLFWPPHRIDLSLNLVLLLLALGFVTLYAALRALNARLGILARQYDSARSDLSGAINALNKYFDPASRRTQSAATVLLQAQAHMKTAELPRLDETLSALATAAAGR